MSVAMEMWVGVVGRRAWLSMAERRRVGERQLAWCFSGCFCTVQVVRPTGAGVIQSVARQMNLPATVVRPPGGEKRRRTGGFACGVGDGFALAVMEFSAGAM